MALTNPDTIAADGSSEPLPASDRNNWFVHVLRSLFDPRYEPSIRRTRPPVGPKERARRRQQDKQIIAYLAIILAMIGLWLGGVFDAGILVFAGFFWVLPIFVGHKIGEPKNRDGWVWGLLLGWIGVIIVACLSPVPTAEQRQLAELEAEVRLAGSRRPKERLPKALL